MYLTTRDTPAESTPIDKKGQDSRIVLVIIGSTILLVIVVCLVIQPIRQLQYVFILLVCSFRAA
jgi:hypothetical protein